MPAQGLLDARAPVNWHLRHRPYSAGAPGHRGPPALPASARQMSGDSNRAFTANLGNSTPPPPITSLRAGLQARPAECSPADAAVGADPWQRAACSVCAGSEVLAVGAPIRLFWAGTGSVVSSDVAHSRSFCAGSPFPVAVPGLCLQDRSRTGRKPVTSNKPKLIMP